MPGRVRGRSVWILALEWEEEGMGDCYELTTPVVKWDKIPQMAFIVATLVLRKWFELASARSPNNIHLFV